MRTLRKVRVHGRATEVAEGGARFTIWPGQPPEGMPEHPSLGWPVAASELDGAPVWLESRPNGALLSELSGLSVPEVGMVMLDVAEALAELHEHDLAHGSVDERHIVVTDGGRAVLIGTGVQAGQAERDALALRELMTRKWPPPGSPPDPGDEPAAVIAETLSGWLDYEYPDHSTLALGTRARQATFPVPVRAERIPWDTELPEALGWLDEVSVVTRSEGLNRWNTTSSHISGAITGALEGTQPLVGFLEDDPRRLALMARLMSPPEVSPDPLRFEEIEGEPCQAIKDLLAEEPLDPLPVPEGVLRRETGGELAARATEPLPRLLPDFAIPVSQRLDTDETTGEAPEEVSPRAMRLVVLGLVLALGAAALVVWKVL